MTPNRLRVTIALIALVGAGTAAAQQLYRWTDENGRTHVTDTPPPPSAKGVQKKSVGGAASSAEPSGEVPFELSLAMKDFPVVLYTSPSCKQVCSDARALLNKRGIPFKEVQVWDEESGNELTKVAGSVFIPTLLVGRSVQKGYTADSFNALLDSARYPKPGVVAARSQAAPPPPKGYTDTKEEAAKAEPVKPEAEEPKGPYSPGAKPPVRTPAKK
jgi:glutaredoxin